MVEKIGPTGKNPLGGVPPGKNSKGKKAAEGAEETKPPEKLKPKVSSKLQKFIDSVREAEPIRKNRVHEVLKKLERGELLAPESIREAAEKLLREGP